MKNNPAYRYLWDKYKKGKIDIKKYIKEILRKEELSIASDAVAEITSRVYDSIYDDITNITEYIKENNRKRISEKDVIEYYSRLGL